MLQGQAGFKAALHSDCLNWFPCSELWVLMRAGNCDDCCSRNTLCLGGAGLTNSGMLHLSLDGGMTVSAKTVKRQILPNFKPLPFAGGTGILYHHPQPPRPLIGWHPDSLPPGVTR